MAREGRIAGRHDESNKWVLCLVLAVFRFICFQTANSIFLAALHKAFVIILLGHRFPFVFLTCKHADDSCAESWK